MLGRRKSLKKEREYFERLSSKIQNCTIKLHFEHAYKWPLSRVEHYRVAYFMSKWIQALLGFVVIALGTFQESVPGILFTIVGGVSAVTSFALALHKCDDNWKRYRTSLEAIKSLTRIYLSGNEPFSHADPQENDKRYVLELDKIIREETREWIAMRDKVDADTT